MQPPARPGAGQAARSGQGPSGGAARAGPGAARKHLNTKVLSGVLRQVKNNVPKNYLAPFLVSCSDVGPCLHWSHIRFATDQLLSDLVKGVCGSYRCSFLFLFFSSAQTAASVLHADVVVLCQSTHWRVRMGLSVWLLVGQTAVLLAAHGGLLPRQKCCRALPLC